jgi:2,4-dienoyl-CoA reductase-like NADH-dependent reductase (Old Yellow Enzyme family)
MAPMVQQAGLPDGTATEELAAFYGARAQAGTGLIIVEATASEADGRCWPGGLGAYLPQHREGLARIASAIRAGGACACLQLVHGGPQASHSILGQPGWGPSAVAPNSNFPPPRELPRAALADLQKRFADAAEMAADAGFQAVELHGAHGYLLDSFLSPDRNRRTDEYGGPMENRLRMLTETVARTKERVGERLVIDCRVSFFNHLHEEFGSEDFRAVLWALERAGCDMVHISCDGWSRTYFGTARTQGQLAKELVRMPVIIAGSLGDSREAERAVAEGHCDVAAVGRAMKSTPDWTARACRRLKADGDSPGSRMQVPMPNGH